MALIRSIATVGGYTLASRILGFVRDVLVAAFLGAGPLADAFVVALRLPNLFRAFSAEGAFSAAFVPMLSRLVATEGRLAALRFAEETLAGLIAALGLFVLAVGWAMPWGLHGIAPGLAGDPAQMTNTLLRARLTLPFLRPRTLAPRRLGGLSLLCEPGGAAALGGGRLGRRHRTPALAHPPARSRAGGRQRHPEPGARGGGPRHLACRRRAGGTRLADHPCAVRASRLRRRGCRAHCPRARCLRPRPAGLRADQGADAGLSGAPRHGDAGQDRRRADPLQPRGQPDLDAGSRPCRHRHRHLDRLL